MKFLFRAPLLDFDPRDEREIILNWDRILKIIFISSTTLFNEINQKTYGSLHPKLKKKVYKYIIRGRYRSTPFGLLAAVGWGEFNDNRNYTIELQKVHPIPQNPTKLKSDIAEKGSFHLAEGGYEKMEKHHFLSFQFQNKRWGIASIPKNKSIDFLINQIKKAKSIDFELFKEWFEDPTPFSAKEIWNRLFELGIFNSVERVTTSKPYQNQTMDMVFKDGISLPSYLNTEISDFFNQAGSLFIKAENQFLKFLRGWFAEKFDDRYIPITLLLQYDDFIHKIFLKRQDLSTEWGVTPGFNLDLSTLESLDLTPLFPQKPLDSGIYDLQLAFKTGVEPKSIVLENAVCNRPFVYFGRFNRDEKLYCQQEKTKDSIYQNVEVHYAELRLVESGNVASICDAKQVFDYYITPMYESDPKAINLEEIEIGLNDNEFQLFHKVSHKKIVPVLVHPLNGEEISHPLMRLMWEIAHQTPYDFFPYTLRKQKTIEYIPQLNWGRLVLQSRRWTIMHSSFPTILQLGKWLENSNLPDPLLMGYLDRELVLHWSENQDLEILWAELCKWKRLVLSDPIWLKNSLFSSQNQRPVYPQLIVQKSKSKNEKPLPLFVNSIESVAKDCLYILFWIQEEECEDFLEYFFDKKLLNFLNQQGMVWYYLVYPDKAKLQVRIRFLKLKRKQRNLLNEKLLKISVNSLLEYEVRPYYPEQKKYGKKDYVKSEQLFHLESILMTQWNLKKVWKEGPGNSVVLELMVKLWVGVILDIQEEEYYFGFIKSRVKSIPTIQMKDFRNYSDKVESDSSLLSEFRDWLKSYQGILFSHSRMVAPREVGRTFVQNHIHMQVNRFFPTERMKMENLLYFLVYRKLGEKLFRNPGI